MGKKFDYNQTEIIVKTQEELDLIPDDYKGQIYIDGGTYFNKICVKKRYISSVVALGNSSVEARGNSTVVAWGNSQVVDYLQGAKIKISGNARIVYNPKNIMQFMDFYDIKHTKTKAIFYKAVHKDADIYRSDNNYNFTYEIGKIVENECDKDETRECSYGLHIAHLNWTLNFGNSWKDLAILEVETKISDIVVPKNTDGKVRTSKLKVIREVPLEECGLYGKILAKRIKGA